MAKCKYCHEPITRLDKDVCPFCGGIHPLDGTDTSTQDVTKVMEQIEKPVDLKHRKRIVAFLLAVILGIFGLHHFYIGKMKRGLISLGISAILIGGIGSLIFFVAWASPFAYLIPYFVVEAFMLVVGISYLLRHDIVDVNGEFLE